MLQKDRDRDSFDGWLMKGIEYLGFILSAGLDCHSTDGLAKKLCVEGDLLTK